MMSLIKKFFVTQVFLPGTLQKFTRPRTTDDKKSVDPRRAQTGKLLSPIFASLVSPSDKADDFADEIEENTSGAPLPKAKNVTPANDSEIQNRSVIYSSEGLRYSSAVEERMYISNISKIIPTGHIANIIPVSPNQPQKQQQYISKKLKFDPGSQLFFEKSQILLGLNFKGISASVLFSSRI